MAPPQRRRTVKIPIRIRVRGSRVDTERLSDHIADLTGRQIGRAADVLDKGGEYRATLRPIEVKFTGAVPSDEDRAEIERAVGRGLVRATWDAHQARRGPHRRKSGAEQVRKRVKGAKDGGKKGKGAKGAKGASAKRPINTWHVFDSVGDRTFNDALLNALKDRFAGSQVPLTYGVLFRRKKDNGVYLLITSNRKWVADEALTDVNFSEAKPRTEAARIDPGSGDYRLEQELDGLKEWRKLAYKHAERQKGTKKSKDPDEPKDILKPKQPAKPEDARGVGTVTHQADILQPARDLAADARAAVDGYTKDWETTIQVYYWLRGGGLNRLLPFLKEGRPNLPIVSRLEVVALVDEVDADDADEAAEELTDGTASGRDSVPQAGGGAGEGQGQGEGAGGTGSDITAPPGQDVGKGGPGIVIAEEYQEGAPIFPAGLPDPNAKSVEITCEPYEDEPSVAELGYKARAMAPLIAQIAKRLDMPPCPWPAHFCIMASRMVAVRASQVQNRFRDDDKGFIEELTVGATDESGGFVFRPLPSVGIQYLQRLAEVVPQIRVLMELVSEHTLPITTKRYAAWGSHWLDRVLDEIFPACALIWYFANQFLMHQLLNTSRDAVQHRVAHFDNYVATFRVLCKTQLADQAEMIILRSALAEFVEIAGKRQGMDAYEAVRSHHLMLRALQHDFESSDVQLLTSGHGLDADLVLRLRDQTSYVFARGTHAGKVGTGQITQSDTGAWVIRASDGTRYTTEMLDKMIMVRQQVIVSIDPLISQLVHRFVSAVRPLVESEDQEAIPAFLRQLFADMLAKNAEVKQKNLADMTYAFEHGQIHKVSDDPKAPPALRIPTVPGGRWVLEGVHALAHSTVGVAFKDDSFYVNAVDRLLAHEHAWRSFAEDMIFIAGIALSVICPPVGAVFGLVAGLTLGVVQYQHAKEQETIYGALVNPDQVLNYAELQIELFMAKLTIGLSFLAVIPEGVAAVKGVSAASKRAIQRGLGSGVKAIAKTIITEELDRLAETCAANFIKGMLLELATQKVMENVVDIVLGPIIEAHIEELEKELRDEGLL